MDEQMKQMIGQRIREERERRGMTLEELAQAVGVASRGQMSRFESGERGVDSMLLHRIAVALEVPMDAFFDAERGQVLAMGRAGEAQSEAMQRMADAGLELLADMEFAEELVGAHGWWSPAHVEGENAALALRQRLDLGDAPLIIWNLIREA